MDAKALITVRQNRYSVPVSLAGLRVQVKVGASEIQVSHQGRDVAVHERLHGRSGTRASLDHYLELMAKKPGALARSLPLAQERDRGTWPVVFDEFWAALRQKLGASEADRQMVDVLMLVREHSAHQVEIAVAGALAAGAVDGRAVALLARRQEERQPPGRLALDERLAVHDRPEPALDDYDKLIGQEIAS